jgi:hypothetical protein
MFAFAKGFIDEDQPSDGDLVLVSLPLRGPTRDVSAILFAGAQTFLGSSGNRAGDSRGS